MNLNSLLTYSRTALTVWHTLDAHDRSRVKLYWRAWLADARAERLAR